MHIRKALLITLALISLGSVSCRTASQMPTVAAQQPRAAQQPATASSPTTERIPEAETLLGMNRAAGDEFRRADVDMNAVYNQVLAEYKDDERFISALKKAQRAWLAYRDAQIEMVFPGADTDPRAYGSVFPMCYAQEQAALTKQRTEVLRRWIDGVEEGDVCSGSINKFKDATR